MRRLTSILGTLALLAAIVPAGLDAASDALDCCNGIMCPMHAPRTHVQECGMDMNGSGAALKPCPVQTATRYTAATLFVLVAPVVLYLDAPSRSAIPLSLNSSPDPERPVDSPPPRPALTA